MRRPPRAGRRERPGRRAARLLCLGGGIVVVDRLTKWWVVTQMEPGQSIPLLPRVLHLSYVQNTGAAFGVLPGQRVLFLLVSAAMIALLGGVLLAHVRRPPARDATGVWLMMILAGAVGNLVDRVAVGYVIDFLDIRVWPVFNVADLMITTGTTLLVLRWLRRRPAQPVA